MSFVNCNYVNVSGEKLKEMREKKGISQKELAEITGLSVRTIARYEAGETQPDRGKMKLLLEVLQENERSEKKRLCPYRTKVTEQGGIMFTHCIGTLCMGYIDDLCSLAQRDIKREKNWFD